MASSKGPKFERELSVILSHWMSDGKCDDWVWRSQTSGGRATSRMKKGKTTSGQHADLAATDSRALPLTETICVEAKRGYTKSGPDEFINRKWCFNPKMKANKLLTMETWYWQVKAAQEGGKQPYWLLIVCKDRRETVVYFPDKLLRDLRSPHGYLMPTNIPEPYMTIVAKVRYDPLKTRTRRAVMHCMLLTDFLKAVPYKAVKMLHKKHKRK